MGSSGEFNMTSNEDLIKYLQNRISDTSSLEDIVNVFEDMCNIPVNEDIILFETGTYSFTDESMFYFSLVRQFPDSEDEYYQLHVDVLYAPSKGNKNFQQCTWNDDIEENIFNYIRKTQEFDFCKREEFCKIDIFLDQT